MIIEIDGIEYSKVFDFNDEILGDVSHFISTKESGEIVHQFFIKKKLDDQIVFVMLDEKDNENIIKKYLGGRK